MSATQEVGEIFGSGKGGVYDAMLRSPTVLIASIGLWGINIYVFKLFSIDYCKVLNHDLVKLEEQHDRVTEQQQQQQQQHEQQVSSTSLQQQRRYRNRANANNSSNPNFLNSSSRSVDDGNDMNKMDIMTDGSTNSTTSGCNKSSVIVTPAEIQSGNNINSISTAETDHTNNNTNSNNSLDVSNKDEIQQRYTDFMNQEKITPTRLIGLSIVLLLLLHSTYTVHLQMLGGNPIGAVFAFYIAFTIVIVFPVIPSTKWLHISTKLVLHRLYELIHPRCYCIPSSSYMLQLPLSNINIANNSSSNSSSSTSSDDEKLNNHNNISNGNIRKIPRPIPFVDVFFADAMCSLSKVFFDWGMLLHMAMYYPNPVPISMYHILIPSSFAAIPYIIRARQCIVMWYVTSMKNDHANKYQHLWNALKYCTSIFPLCLSAFQKTMIEKDRARELEPLLIILLIVNASYALWWDIVMDWGMMKNPTVAATAICSIPPPPSSYQSVPMRDSSPTNEVIMRSPMGRNPSSVLLPLQSSTSVSGITSSSSSLPSPSVSCWHTLLRNRLRFGVWISVLILATDIVLRFSWTLRFHVKLFPSDDAFVLFTQFLEVIRRALWNLLRVEWENLKQSGQHHQGQQITKPMTPASVVLVQMTSIGNKK